MRSGKFLTGILIILAAYIVTCFTLNQFYEYTPEIKRACLYAGIIAFINVLIAFFSILLIGKKPAANFTKLFLITFSIRFLFLLGIIIIILLKGGADQFTFLVSFFILYFLFQIWEIYIIHRHLRQV